jgi:galactokinase
MNVLEWEFINQARMNQQIVTDLKSKFQDRYSQEPLIVRSPGRVNIIGEHTDYNNGFVLPAAIDKAIYVAIAKSKEDTISLYSEEFQQEHGVEVNKVERSEKQWPNYILGVVDQLIKRGYNIPGFNLSIDGDVPIGAGLSSSAAVECATAFALNELFQLKIPKSELILIAQKAEHEFAGVMCGIMDQFASMFGKKDHVIRLDCQTLEYEYEPLQLGGYKVLLLNTNVEHSLASTEYNTRRKECAEGVELVKKHYPEVNSLRNVTMDMLNECVKDKNDVVYKRCKYVVEEIERLLSACEALKAGNVKVLGEKMFATHDGLSNEYEVSCKELDFLVDQVRNNPAVLGARMMGGGFGGCTINLVKEEAIPELIDTVSKSYQEAMGRTLTAYVVQIEDGTSIC